VYLTRGGEKKKQKGQRVRPGGGIKEYAPEGGGGGGGGVKEVMVSNPQGPECSLFKVVLAQSGP